ncbi:molybdate ABC transporter substrate-binding protein [Candidatus Nitrospira allomarina]|uniref:Molybdate ABC transporter substrate-binding protein n=1 Tax=Candidatus Nitrospira allomarina TaxID=3020900 RepID=A0AA96GB58_9BACT|nr:molybdate ABC transporter substrate-binding protein [Candidatus Nitrospira allomarina]WNM56935.1 molybdate ABC transporter substrate-binding protein [Candidatus Nitrospira allomarina]
MMGIRNFGRAIALVGGILGVVATGGPVQAEALTIGAAPSLRAALQEIVPMFEKEYDAAVKVVYGPSQIFRRQIEKGAPIDVFLPAAVGEVEKLQKKRLTLNGGPRVYAQTSLVLVMSATSRVMPISFREALPNGAIRMALGDPNTSSLGEITAQALAKLDPHYKSRFKLVYAAHAGDIVNLIHTGKADMGIIYRVDAINNPQVRIIDENPAGMHIPVRFGEAVVSTCRKASLNVAKDFFDFIMSPRIQKLLVKYGFDHDFDSVSSNG